MLTFAHLADTHIGSWRDEKMRQLSVAAFTKAVDICVQENVDFVLISGDFFDTSIPPIDKIKSAVIQLKRLKEKNILVYMISGSHDHSPSGKTMLDVLEEAGLFVNVVKGTIVDNKLRLAFTIDQKTGTRITGMLGKRGTLEKSFYEQLDREFLEQEIKGKQGHHIFMFHSALNEFKPENNQAQESMPVSLLPRGFNYYAGGHVHMVFHRDETANGYGIITYPGPTFPCDFKEIEELKRGGMYIVTFDGTSTRAVWKQIEVVPVESITISCNHQSAEATEEELRKKIAACEHAGTIRNCIITIRIAGTLRAGKLSDIRFNDIIEHLYHTGAFFVMKNTSAVTSPEFEEIKRKPEQTVEQIQESAINEHLGQIPIEGLGKEEEKELTKKLLGIFSAEKNEGETTADFEKRMVEQTDAVCKEFFDV
ncbi:MAG: exonuclease SbcCD subunit D [Candidatus Woesearchaeota archaeon]|nr:exonuclease SbcCD subunit D [Candidatus Woesearchaeota archaeon]